jgi:diguanylate cyclase (GGDEF)-like protein/PAS domain S-box-containing protein
VVRFAVVSAPGSSSGKRVPDSTHRVQERLRTYRQILAGLLRSEALSSGDIEAAYRQITELATQLLEVERASVWRLESTNQLRCWDLYERTRHAHSSGQVILEREVPSYFAALAEERCLAVHDAHKDPRTSGFARGYLTPLGIGAMLDAPIWVSGRMVGVVCHEHVGGPRLWRLDEELLAGTVADFVARVIEAADRLRAERALGQYRDHIQELVGLRGKQREQLNVVLEREATGWHAAQDEHQELEEARRVFGASPVPMIVTRLRDGEVRYVNQRARELFEVTTDAIDLRTQDFYVDQADRTAFLDELRAAGRADGFVAQLRTHQGRLFWALMSAVRMPYQGDECLMVAFSDVTAQKLAEIAVRQSAQNLRTLFAAAPVPLILSRIQDRKVVLANQRAADLFGLELSEVVGESTPNYYVDQEQRRVIVEKLLEDGRVEHPAVRLRTRSGKEFWASLSARVLDFEGESCFLVGVHDVTMQKELEEQLRDLATRDALTGVYNRRHFMDLAHREIERVARTNSPLCSLMLDADHFKRINDAHGHAAGDRVLAALARAAGSVLRRVDVFARIGGEEFLALLPDTTVAEAAGVAERIHHAIRQTVVTTGENGGAPIQPTVSIGVTALRPGDDLESLLRRVDAALYRAKQEGRDRTAVVE